MRLALLASAIVHVVVVVAARSSDVRVPIGPAPAASSVAAIDTEIDRWAGTTSLPGRGGGEQVDVDVERAVVPATPATVATPAAPVAAAPVRPVPRRKPRPPAAPSGASTAAPAADARPGGGGGEPGDFGAEEKAGVRDLGRAFTRAIPPASDSDPAWAKLPAGDAGTLTVEILVDAEGKIASFEPRDREPPRHLVGMVKRTLAWMGSGTFALRGQVGAGSQLLRLRARVSDVEVPEDRKTGGAFNLRHRFASGRGSASFTQVGGRHVEIEVEVVRGVTR